MDAWLGRWLFRGLAAASVAFLAACGGGSSGGGTPNVLLKGVNLSGAQENPAVTTAATGSGFISVNLDDGTVTGRVTTFGITANAAHIHTGAVGVNGPVLIGLEQESAGIWIVPEGATMTADQVAAMRAGTLYVNVHTVANPGGEIRGQLGRQLWFASLTGAQETPPVATAAAGTARLVFEPETRSLSGTVATTGITANAAHIHTAAIGVPGPVTIGLEGGPVNWSVPAGTVLTEAQVANLAAGSLYVNVHTTAHPAGEIRGQLYLPAKGTTLSGALETPPNSSAATGIGWLVVNPFTLEVAGRIETTGVTATAAHVHRAAPGVPGPVVIGLVSPAPGVWVTEAGARLTDELLLAFMRGELYFNVHSAAFPGGEIRGQLVGGQ